MLNTATWTNGKHVLRTLSATDLMPDFDKGELKPISGHGISHESRPQKPYVYGRSTSWARQQLARVQANLNTPVPQ